jgi:TP901 family phage tail tape measure protein
MAIFAEKANRSAKALSTTTTAYTDAALIFYQQGLEGDAVTKRTDAVIKMSNVTGESAADVSSYMTAVWNNFDDGSKSLEYYADVMTALGAATASSTDEIAAGLEKFASIGDTVGLSYEYATSALATVVAETRQSADTVGTAFKTIFARLQGLSLGETLEDGTDLNKYSEALAKVGVKIKDEAGNMKEMDQILEDLGSRWGTLAKDQQMALAQTVAGTRQYTQLISLMDNWSTFQQNLTTAQTSEGSLQK